MFPQQTLLIPVDTDTLARMMREAVRAELATYTPPTPAAQLPEYLTRHETAKLYRISLVTLHEWDRAGTIPKKITVNGRIRYRRDEILNTIENAKKFKHKKHTTGGVK